MLERNGDARDRLIFPLDVPDWAGAVELVDKLKGRVGYFKIGLELFISRGPEAVRDLVRMSGDLTGVFLDLKLCDIPATVGRAMKVISGLGVDLTTIHASGGAAMIASAAFAAGTVKVLAVTVLTSLDVSRDPELGPELRKPGALVRSRAETALEAGCHGLVCSGMETADLRRRFGPEPLLVVPGIRPAWSLVEGDDQRRIVTPAAAVKTGADLLVVGRPIRDAPDPAEAADRVVEEIKGALGASSL